MQSSTLYANNKEKKRYSSGLKSLQTNWGHTEANLRNGGHRLILVLGGTILEGDTKVLNLFCLGGNEKKLVML